MTRLLEEVGEALVLGAEPDATRAVKLNNGQIALSLGWFDESGFEDEDCRTLDPNEALALGKWLIEAAAAGDNGVA